MGQFKLGNQFNSMERWHASLPQDPQNSGMHEHRSTL
jgi:hypothetical protein